jgi:hypothetical protein
MRSIFYLIAALVAFLVGISIYAMWNVPHSPFEVPSQTVLLQQVEKHGHKKPSMVKGEAGYDCLVEDDLLNAVQKLSEGGYSEFERTKELFLKDAGRSPRCRENIIAALMNAMQESDPNYKSNRDTYFLWRYGSELLGELKAVEALDLLISHMGFTFGSFSSSMRHQPVLYGVICMGGVAIPKLAAVLQENPDRDMRMYAVFCLSRIGGQSAMTVLRGAFPSESDKCVSEFIRVVVKAFDNKLRPNQITMKDQDEWYTAFHFCGE